MKKQTSSKLSYIAFAAIAAWFIYNLSQGGLLSDNSVAPDWSLKRVDGQGGKLSLKELKGNVLIMDFWSPYCPPCVKEIPVLEKIARNMAGRGVKVVGISAGGAEMEDLLKFAKKKNPGYPWVADFTGAISNAYKVQSLPTLYILGKDGKIVDSHVGYWGEDNLLSAVNNALNN